MVADKNKSSGKSNGPLRSSASDRERGLSLGRRKFLRTVGALAGVGAVVYASFDLGFKRIIKIARKPVFYRDSTTGRLSEHEMKTMITLLEVLVPVKLWPSREAMARMVNDATENYKGVLKEYKAGLSLLDWVAQVRRISPSFAEAGIEDRQRILESLMWKYEGSKRDGLKYYVNKLQSVFERLFHSEPERRFREFVACDLLLRFYTKEVAWKLVGYPRYPGIPGDPREYVRPLSLN